jgi:hypothetical protein
MRRSADKTLNCRICGDEVHRVGSETTAVTCWRCVAASLKGTIVEDDNEDFISDKNEDHE